MKTVKKHKQNDVILMGPGEPLQTGWSWENSLMRWPLNGAPRDKKSTTGSHEEEHPWKMEWLDRMNLCI